MASVVPTSRRVKAPDILAVAGMVFLACSSPRRTASVAETRPAGRMVVCPMAAWSSVIAVLRDPGGRAVARGATLEIRSATYRHRVPAYEAYDTLQLGGRYQVAGEFTVRASKPGYVSAETTGVHVAGGPCGATERVFVPMTLRLRKYAPAVRSVAIFVSGVGLGPGVYTTPMTAYVNAADGIDTTVEWRSSNPKVVTVDRNGLITSRCLTRKATAVVTATSRADPSVRASIPVDVWGDPQMCGTKGR